MTATDQSLIVFCSRHWRTLGQRIETLRPRRQCAQANQIVRRGSKGHDPIDELAASVPQLPQAAHGFHPSEHLFDQLAPALANRVARVSSRAAVDRTTGLLSDMRRDFKLPHLGYKRRDVVVFVATDGFRPRRG